MSRSRAATVSEDESLVPPLVGDDGAQPDHSTTETADPTNAGPRRRDPKEKVPQTARLWGFVRHLSLQEILNGDGGKTAAPAEQDAKLWWDVDRHRFLVVSEDVIIDDLSPLQFVQFVRELRDVTSRILYKFERRNDGSTGRAHRVWS